MDISTTLVKEVFWKTGERKVKNVEEFSSETDFIAYHNAADKARKLGYTVASMCSPEPTAIAKGFEHIAKWYNIPKSDGHLIEGVLISDDFRSGPVYLVEFE